MNAPLRLGFGHALHAVDAALEFETRIRALALDHEADLLKAAKLGLIGTDALGLEALCRRVHRIHSIEHRGKQRGFFAARPLPNFDDDVLVVVRVFRQQQNFQFFVERLAPAALGVKFLRSQFAQLAFRTRVVAQFRRAVAGGDGGLVFAVFFDDGQETFALLHQGGEAVLLGKDCGVGERFFDFGKALFGFFEIFNHVDCPLNMERPPCGGLSVK